MAGSQVTIVANQIDKQRLGYQAISLTNYDNDLEPQIAQGSKVEIAGALFEFPADESITGWGGIANDTDVYIKLVVAGASATAVFTTTEPTWNTAKQGWYDGLDRYVAYLYKDSSGNYAAKQVLGNQDTLRRPGSTVETLSGSGNWTVPARVRIVKATIIGAGGGGGGAVGTSRGSTGGDTTFNGETASGGRGGLGSQLEGNGLDARNGFVSANGGEGGVFVSADNSGGQRGEGGNIEIRIWSATPGQEFSYSVGTGGAGGAGSDGDGGDGGDGIIILEY